MDLGWILGVSGWIWGGSGVDLGGSGVDLGSHTGGVEVSCGRCARICGFGSIWDGFGMDFGLCE